MEMDNNKRMILATVLSIAVLLVWQYFFVPEPAPVPVQQAEQSADINVPNPEASTAAEEPTPSLSAFAPTEGREVTVSTPLYTAVFHTSGGILRSFKLEKYRTTIEAGAPAVDLVGSASRAKAPMGILVDGRPSWHEGQWQFDGADLSLGEGESGVLRFVGEIAGKRLVRELSFSGDTYLVGETLDVVDATGASVETRIGLTVSSEALTAEDDRYNLTRISYLNAEGLTDESDVDDLSAGMLAGNGLKWAAVDSNYFIAAVAPGFDGANLKAKFEDGVYRAAVEKDRIPVNGSGSQLASSYYFGPKVQKYLAAAPNELESSVNYGWFDFIAKPLLVAMNLFHDYVGNYGIAIIILTIIIKIIFWPLSYKSYKSMNQMKKLQPMMAKLREKYSDDRQRLNQEMMALYKTYKVNPAGGCFPMLIQIPVFIGLYQALLNAIELRHAVFIPHVPFTDIIWLADLSAKDPFYVTPIVMGATMFLQQKLTPAPGDPAQAKMMMFLPLIFTFMFLNFPSGLVVYWLVNNVLSIAQQWWMLRKVN